MNVLFALAPSACFLPNHLISWGGVVPLSVNKKVALSAHMQLVIKTKSHICSQTEASGLKAKQIKDILIDKHFINEAKRVGFQT